MKSQRVFLYVFDGYADWEPALAIAGLQRWTACEVQTFADDKKPIRSMGNLHVIPDFSIDELNTASIDLLMLPGGDRWEKGGGNKIKSLTASLVKQEKNIAAMCAATVFLAREGWLDHSEHTSNTLPYLQGLAPDYKGEDWYINKPAVSGRHIITANGTAMKEFAAEIFRATDPENANLKKWFSYFS